MVVSLEPSGEPQRLLADLVYIDASTYRSLQFDWSGRWFSGLADLAKRSLIRVVVTDLTRREVTGLMRETWAETNKAVQKSVVLLRQLGHGPALDALADEEACVAKMNAGFDAWLRECRVFVCKEEADMAIILDDYFARLPPFGGGAKKAEFPDALVMSSLRRWASSFKRSLYVVANDGDLEKCCEPGGPFIFARTVREILSHGTASARIHEAVLTAAKRSVWLADRLGDDAEGLDVQISRGYVGGARVDVEVRTVKLDGFDVTDLVIDTLVEDTVSATVFAWCELELRVVVEQEGGNDWDYRSRHEQRLTISQELTATVGATVAKEGDVDLFEAWFDDRRVHVSWREVEREIDVHD